MKLYDFKRLIDKYSVTFSLQRVGGKFVSGKWEHGDDIIEEMTGAIVPISDKKVYGNGGTYSTQDRELYVKTPIGHPLSDVKVIYKGNAYSVEEAKNFEDYADAVVYVLRWQSKAVSNHA